MKIFNKVYNKALQWAQSKYALYWLVAISFFESFILPYPPPDVILAPMALKTTDKAYKFAAVCTILSTVGGVIGYFIGSYAIDAITPFIKDTNYIDKLTIVKSWFDKYGMIIIIVAGFSPLPYKVFAIGAGVASMAFLPFVILSFLARGVRFFLVVFIVLKFGKKLDNMLQKYVDHICYVLIIIILGIWYFN